MDFSQGSNSKQKASPVQDDATDLASHTFKIPEKQIASPMDLGRWQKSQAYSELMGFILTVNEAVKRKKIGDEYPVSKVVENIVAILEMMSTWIDDIPPLEQHQRFGNKAFKTWFAKLKEEGPGLVANSLSSEFHPAVPEISTYLVEGVGNDTRIDYGSGHELAFVAFLCCLCKIGALTVSDHAAIALKIFDKYLRVMRKLQTRYRMEPAGSHGVYSIDDFQFLPFLWGSAQLIEHRTLSPESYVMPDVAIENSDDYLYMSAIKYINEGKTGLFAEHSNILWSMSSVPSWSKINSGLVKMYKAEVLAKFPVVQHFFFGSLLTLDPAQASRK